MANEHSVELVVLDYSMPEMNGEEVANVLKQEHPDLLIVLYSGVTDIPERVFALVDGFVTKADGCLFLIDDDSLLASTARGRAVERT